MLPICLSRSAIDSDQWDQLIEKSQQNVVYAKSWYLDIVCQDWNAIVWPSTGNYEVLMPLPLKTKFGRQVIQQPFYCQFLGIFSQNEITVQIAYEFLTVLDLNFNYISAYCFNPHNFRSLNDQLGRFEKFRTQIHCTHLLNMSRSFSEIYSGYSSDRRLNIKRSQEAGWSIKESKDITPLIALFSENHASGIQGGVSDSAYALLVKLYMRLRENGYAKLYYANKNETIHAGVFLVKSDTTTIYLFNAADKTGRNGNGRSFILNEYFQENAGFQHVFDFESPQIASIARFYKSFGSEETHFFSIIKNDLGFPWKQVQNLRKAILTAWK